MKWSEVTAQHEGLEVIVSKLNQPPYRGFVRVVDGRVCLNILGDKTLNEAIPGYIFDDTWDVEFTRENPWEVGFVPTEVVEEPTRGLLHNSKSLVDVLHVHWRTTTNGCACGWRPIIRDEMTWKEHVANVYRDALRRDNDG